MPLEERDIAIQRITKRLLSVTAEASYGDYERCAVMMLAITYATLINTALRLPILAQARGHISLLRYVYASRLRCHYIYILLFAITPRARWRKAIVTPCHADACRHDTLYCYACRHAAMIDATPPLPLRCHYL